MPENLSSDSGSTEPLIIKPVPFRHGRKRNRTGLRRLVVLAGLSAAGALLSVLAGGVWFVFTARQVSIQVDPLPETVSLSGAWFTPRIGDHYLLRPGNYVLHATLSCHRDITHRFEVGSDERQEIRLFLQKLPGRLRIFAHRDGRPEELIPGAEVFIDGRSAGVASAEPLEAVPGRRRIEIQSDRFQSAATEIEVEGCDRIQEIALALIPNWSGVRFTSIPSGAAVKVDGLLLGKTPIELELAAGVREIEISAERHKTWRSRLEVSAGSSMVLPEVRLEPADGRLAIRSRPAGASVLVDGRYVGQTPVDVGLGAAKEHDIQLSKSGYERASRTVTVASGEARVLEVELTAQEGLLHLRVEPADAELFVNGIGRGKVGLSSGCRLSSTILKSAKKVSTLSVPV